MLCHSVLQRPRLRDAVGGVRPRSGAAPSPGIRGQTTAHRSSRCAALAPFDTAQMAFGFLGAAAVSMSLAVAGPSAAQEAAKSTAPGEIVGGLTENQVNEKRAAFMMKRAYDGRVAIQDKNTGEWCDVKVDAMAPGLLLLRNHGTSLVYAVAYDSMAQIDLSDDDVVEAISVDDWEKDASLVPSKDGRTAGLMLNREAFYDVISVMAAAPAVAN